MPFVSISSFIEIGIPCNKPSFSPFFTESSAFFAISLAKSNVGVQKALIIGFIFSILSIIVSVISCEVISCLFMASNMSQADI